MAQIPHQAVKREMEKPTIVQFEITGKDAGAQQHFYASLFGWEMHGRPGYERTRAAETGLPGAIGSTRSGPNGGRDEGWDGGSGQLTVYVEVADLPATLSAAEKLGGKIVAPLYEVPGRQLAVAFIADPEGHVVGLSQGLRRAIEQAGFANTR